MHPIYLVWDSRFSSSGSGFRVLDMCLGFTAGSRLSCNFFVLDVTSSFSLLTPRTPLPHPLAPTNPAVSLCVRGGNELIQTITCAWLEAQTRRLSCFEVAVTATSPLARPLPEAVQQPYIKLLCSLTNTYLSHQALAALTFDNHSGMLSIPCLMGLKLKPTCRSHRYQ